MARTPLAVGASVFFRGVEFSLGVTRMPITPHVPRDDDDGRKAPDIGDVVERIINGGDDPSPVTVSA